MLFRQEALFSFTKNGSSALHLAASSGNLYLINQFINKFPFGGPEWIRFVNTPNATGKGCRDQAAYNKVCNLALRDAGAEFLIDKPAAFQEGRVPADHHWNREAHRPARPQAGEEENRPQAREERPQAGGDEEERDGPVPPWHRGRGCGGDKGGGKKGKKGKGKRDGKANGGRRAGK